MSLDLETTIAIIDCLVDLDASEDNPIDARMIAKKVGGENSKKSLVNPYLYSMQKLGMVNMVKDGSTPKWYSNISTIAK